MAVTATILASCGGAKTTTAEADKFDYTVEQFADLQILRYKVPEFETLTLKQKELVYYLTQAALEGRDILFDQNGKYNLRIRRMLEAVYTNYKGDKSAPDFKNRQCSERTPNYFRYQKDRLPNNSVMSSSRLCLIRLSWQSV